MGMQIDQGQLSGIDQQTCFILGYKYATIETKMKSGTTFDCVIRSANLERIKTLCKQLGGDGEFTWIADDSSESWVEFVFKGFRV